MDVLEYAMQMELDGEKFYRDLAAQTADVGLTGILTRMAEMEVKHYDTFKALKEGAPDELAPDVVRDGAKTLFAKMAEDGQAFSLEEPQVELYRKAEEIERKARDFYREKAEEIEDEAAKAIVLRIADEEELHCQLLGSIVEHVSRPVEGNWIENAEWCPAGEY